MSLGILLFFGGLGLLAVVLMVRARRVRSVRREGKVVDHLIKGEPFPEPESEENEK